MHRLAPLVLAFLLAPPRASSAQGIERLFYYVDREVSYNSLVKNIELIDVLGPQVYTVDSLGILWGSLDSRVVALAKAKGVKVMPLVVNEGFNQPALRRLLSDSTARRRAVESMVAICKENGATLIAVFEICAYLGKKGVEKTEPTNTGVKPCPCTACLVTL